MCVAQRSYPAACMANPGQCIALAWEIGRYASAGDPCVVVHATAGTVASVAGACSLDTLVTLLLVLAPCMQIVQTSHLARSRHRCGGKSRFESKRGYPADGYCGRTCGCYYMGEVFLLLCC